MCYLYKLEDNCFTKLYWLLLHSDMNQPWACIYPLPLELPSHPSRLSTHLALPLTHASAYSWLLFPCVFCCLTALCFLSSLRAPGLLPHLSLSLSCPCIVAKSCLTFCDPVDCNPPSSFCPWDFPGKNTGVGCPFLLQGNLPDPDFISCLAGSFFTTEPPGKPQLSIIYLSFKSTFPKQEIRLDGILGLVPWKMGSQMEICQMECSWRTFKISTMEDLREEDRIEEKLNCKAVLM